MFCWQQDTITCHRTIPSSFSSGIMYYVLRAKNPDRRSCSAREKTPSTRVRGLLVRRKAGKRESIGCNRVADLYFEEVRVTVRGAGSYRNRRTGSGEKAPARNNGETRACNTAPVVSNRTIADRYLANYLIVIRTKAASKGWDDNGRLRIARTGMLELLFPTINFLCFRYAWHFNTRLCRVLRSLAFISMHIVENTNIS